MPEPVPNQIEEQEFLRTFVDYKLSVTPKKCDRLTFTAEPVTNCTDTNYVTDPLQCTWKGRIPPELETKKQHQNSMGEENHNIMTVNNVTKQSE